MRYSLDTSALSNGWVKLYPPDIFPGLWERMSDAIQAGEIVASDEVLLELHRGDQELHRWCLERRELFLSPTESIQLAVREVSSRYPTLVDVQRARGQADPWVVAVAMAHHLTVVTEELSKPTKPKIPDACRGESVQCINLLTMIREFGWTFSR